MAHVDLALKVQVWPMYIVELKGKLICSGDTDRTLISGLHASDMPQFTSVHDPVIKPSLHTDVTISSFPLYCFSCHWEIYIFHFSENAEVSVKKYRVLRPKNTLKIKENLPIFPVDCFPFFKWLLSYKKTYHLNVYMCVVSVLRSFLGPLCLWQYFYSFRVWPHIWTWNTF